MSDNPVENNEELSAPEPVEVSEVEDTFVEDQLTSYIEERKAAQAAEAVSYTHLTLPTNREV